MVRSHFLCDGGPAFNFPAGRVVPDVGVFCEVVKTIVVSGTYSLAQPCSSDNAVVVDYRSLAVAGPAGLGVIEGAASADCSVAGAGWVVVDVGVVVGVDVRAGRLAVIGEGVLAEEASRAGVVLAC